MHLLRVPLLCAALATSSLAQAPDPTLEKLLAEARQNSQVMPILDHLTNQIGPRLTGSQRLNEACEWARATFASYGLEARLEKWGEVEVGFDRGASRGLLSAKNEQGQADEVPLVFGTHAWTAGTKGVQRGKALLLDKDAEIDALAARSKGAWIVVGKGGAQNKADKLCKEHGGLGIVRSGGQRILTDGNLNTRWSALPTVPVVNLRADQHQDLVERLTRGVGVELEFDIQNHFRKGPIPVYNVIAELKGREKPAELVIVGGHIDSWDGATGTTDNGTGTATTLEVARLLTVVGAKPRRTIRFMLWSGEEQGLLGSRAYIKAHPEENARISAVLVHDGGTNYVSGICALEDMVPLFEKVFAPVLKLDPEMPFAIRPVKNLPFMIGSDHDSYLMAKVPGFFWDQKGRADYGHTHHTQHDTYDAAIPEYQHHTSQVIAVGALGIANLPGLLPRRQEITGQPNAAVSPRRLGVELDAETMTIQAVHAEGVAAASKLKAGDKILAVEGAAVKDRTELANALNEGGTRKKLKVLRAGKEVSVEIVFPETKKKSGG